MSSISTQRKQEIVEAATRCFARRGFHQTSVNDICTEAGLSPGSLYRYFRSKEEIIQAMVEDDQKKSAALIESLTEKDDLIAGLQSVAMQILSSYDDPSVNAMHAEVTAEAVRNPIIRTVVQKSDAAVLEALTEVIQRAQRANKICPALDANLLGEVLIALLDGLWWRQALRPDSDPKRHAELLSLLLERFLKPLSKN